VAGYHARSGATVSPEDVVLTSSTSEAYAFLFKILADFGESIAIPRPSYPLLEYLAAVEGASTEAYDLDYDGTWHIDFDSLARAAGPGTRAVVCVHPNNPTGSYLGRTERERLLRFCRERGLALVIDEVFFDYPIAPHDEMAGSFAGIECDTPVFVLSGLSKLVGLPQMKLAWICLGGPARARRDARLRLEHVADLFLSVGTPVQQAAPDLLGPELVARAQGAIRKRVVGNHMALRQRMAQTPAVSPLDVEGGWYAVLRLPAVRSDEDWCLELLAGDGVYAHPGHFFDFRGEAYLVVSLLTPEEGFTAGLDAIARRVNGAVAA
jgi:aspartate/methionine/tyrosine aminotransferase